MTNLDLHYEPETGILTINGCRYSIELFDALGWVKGGEVLEIMSRDDGVLTVKYYGRRDPRTNTIVRPE